MASFDGLHMGLGNLSRLSNALTRSISAENPTGEKGRGALAPVESATSAARELGRELNPALFSPDEYVARCKAGDHFIASVLAGPRVWLVGDDDTLAALA